MSINEAELDFDYIMLATSNVNQSLTRSCHRIRRTWRIILREMYGEDSLAKVSKNLARSENNFVGPH